MNSTHIPEVPQIIKGWLLKSCKLYLKWKLKYFVMNATEGTLIRFKQLQDYPNKPIEIIPLKSIKGLSKTQDVWCFFCRGYQYFLEFYYNKKRYVCGSLSELAIDQWIVLLDKGIKYARYTEGLFKLQTEGYHASLLNALPLTTNTEIILTDEHTLPLIKPKGQVDRAKFTSSYQYSLPTDYKNIDTPEEEIKKKFKKKPASMLISPMNTVQTWIVKEFNQYTENKVSVYDFKFLQILGKGAFGRVYKAQNLKDGQIYALKTVKKSSKNSIKYAINECNILKSLYHPFILTLHYSFQTNNYLYMAVDYCEGGDLKKLIKSRGRITEYEARIYLAELILAIQHLHSMDYVYRDLNPNNILLGADRHIKLADFGLSKEIINYKVTTNTFCGTFLYLSPEMVERKKVGKAADLYGIGIVLYEMLIGSTPFYDQNIDQDMDQNINQIKKMMKSNKITFPEYISPDAKDLIISLMKIDPNSRIGSRNEKDLRSHRFFKNINWSKVLRKEYSVWIPENKQDEFTMNAVVIHDDFNDAFDEGIFVENFSFSKDKIKVI